MYSVYYFEGPQQLDFNHFGVASLLHTIFSDVCEDSEEVFQT